MKSQLSNLSVTNISLIVKSILIILILQTSSLGTYIDSNIKMTNDI